MSDKKKAKKADDVEKARREVEADRLVEAALKAVSMRREGASWGDIADSLGRSIVEVQELAKVAYARLGEQTVDALRAESEDKIDAVIRQAHFDLGTSCKTQSERTALYRVLLAAEAQRARLFGLNMRPDDEGGHDDGAQ